MSFRGELIIFGSHDNLNTEDVYKILCMINLSLLMVLLISIEIILSQSRLVVLTLVDYFKEQQMFRPKYINLVIRATVVEEAVTLSMSLFDKFWQTVTVVDIRGLVAMGCQVGN